jgi:hypothetical protein
MPIQAEKPETSLILPEQVWTLPPLILHPFADAGGPGKLVESSRASLMLEGLVPNTEFTRDELTRRLLDGRYCEIRMLFYVGKDLSRWLEQCVEFARRDEALSQMGVRKQSFSTLLVEDPPETVREKLRRWGVVDYKSIFTRALGLNTVFADLPPRAGLSDEFVGNYYRFADHMFACRQSLTPYTAIQPANFHFELYASGEYSRLLEREWAEP